MKYTVRFVFYYYDEWDTTYANIYDIKVEAENPSIAVKFAEMKVARKTKYYSSPGGTKFISVTDENGEIYVSNLSEKNNYYGVSLPMPDDSYLIKLPKEKHDQLPEKFCGI